KAEARLILVGLPEKVDLKRIENLQVRMLGLLRRVLLVQEVAHRRPGCRAGLAVHVDLDRQREKPRLETPDEHFDQVMKGAADAGPIRPERYILTTRSKVVVHIESVPVAERPGGEPVAGAGDGSDSEIHRKSQTLADGISPIDLGQPCARQGAAGG